MRQFRKDDATARKIDIALVQQKICSTADARQYLQSESIAEEVIERVLSNTAARSALTGAAVNAAAPGAAPETAPAQPPGPSPYCATGRRKDVVRAAIVQAALAIRDLPDAGRAERLLRREGLPDAVIARVLGGHGPRRGHPVPQGQ